MERLGPVHILFLRQLAANDKQTHLAPTSIKQDELNQMVLEGLLIEYVGPAAKRYTVTQLGARLAQSYGDSPELEKIAIEFVMSKGYNQEDAAKIVKDHGSEVILRTKRVDEGGGSGQKEINMKSEGGKPVFNPIESL